MAADARADRGRLGPTALVVTEEQAPLLRERLAGGGAAGAGTGAVTVARSRSRGGLFRPWLLKCHRSLTTGRTRGAAGILKRSRQVGVEATCSWVKEIFYSLQGEGANVGRPEGAGGRLLLEVTIPFALAAWQYRKNGQSGETLSLRRGIGAGCSATRGLSCAEFSNADRR